MSLDKTVHLQPRATFKLKFCRVPWYLTTSFLEMQCTYGLVIKSIKELHKYVTLSYYKPDKKSSSKSSKYSPRPERIPSRQWAFFGFWLIHKLSYYRLSTNRWLLLYSTRISSSTDYIVMSRRSHSSEMQRTHWDLFKQFFVRWNLPLPGQDLIHLCQHRVCIACKSFVHRRYTVSVNKHMGCP